MLLLRADRRTLLPYIGEGLHVSAAAEIPADALPWADVIHAGKVVRLGSLPTSSRQFAWYREIALAQHRCRDGDCTGRDRDPEALPRPMRVDDPS